MLTAKHFLKRQQSFEETEWYSSPFNDGSLLEFEQVFNLLQQIIQKKMDKKMEEAIYTGHSYIAFSFDLLELYWIDFSDRRKIRRHYGWYWFYQKVIHPLLIQAEEKGFCVEIDQITRKRVAFCLYIPIQQQKQWQVNDEEAVLRQKAIEALAIQYSKKYGAFFGAIKAVWSTQKQEEMMDQWREGKCQIF